MRLIDADAFKAEGRELYRHAEWDLREVHYSQMDVECNIDNMPTIEAEPVVRCKECFIQHICRFAQFLGNEGHCSQGKRWEEVEGCD